MKEIERESEREKEERYRKGWPGEIRLSYRRGINGRRSVQG